MRRINRNAMAILNDRTNGTGDFMCSFIRLGFVEMDFSCPKRVSPSRLTLREDGQVGALGEAPDGLGANAILPVPNTECQRYFSKQWKQGISRQFHWL